MNFNDAGLPLYTPEEWTKVFGYKYRFAPDNEAAKRRRTKPHYKRRKRVTASHKIEFQIRGC